MAREYAPIFLDWPTVTRELNAQEKGRLIDAIVAYQAGGDWQEQIKGNERYVFPGYQVRIDRWNEVSEKRAKASKGEQAETNDNKPEQAETNDSKMPKVKSKKVKQEGEVKGQDYNDSSCAGAWITDSEIQESLERDRKIEDMARRWGLAYSEGHMLKARDLAKEYTLEWLLMAIERSGSGTSQTWGYVEGILRNWKQNGGPDAPRKQQQKPTKVVSAQQYEQREYSSGELDEIGDDLLAEAKRLRGTG